MEKYLTISVDDGHPTDLKAAELLSRFGLKATFYVPKENPERTVIGSSEIRELSTAFEIGAHTLSHLPLTRLHPEVARNEVVGGKIWLEDILGTPVRSFCYPRGKFNRKIVELARQAGYLGSRTCMQNLTSIPKDPQLWGVTTQAYSHSRPIQIRHALIEGNLEGLVNFFAVHRTTTDWESHFKFAVEQVLSSGGVAHLYFHSWEIEERDEWKKLEGLLQWLASKTELARVTNGDLFALKRLQTTTAKRSHKS